MTHKLPAHLRRSLGTLLLAGLASASVHAELQFRGDETFQGTGLGSVNTVLTIQSPGNTSTETGAVSVGAMNEEVISGDAKTGQSQTGLRTLGDLGLGSATDLRVIFNALEPSGNAIDLNDLVLNIYSPTGSLLFSSGAFSPVSFDSSFPGTGNAGFVFGLDATQAAAAQSSAFSGDFGGNRIGLAASASGATGGFETFFVGSVEGAVSPVPEPQSWALMGAGLLAVVLMRRRQRRD